MTLSQVKQLFKRYLMHRAARANYKFILKDWVSLRDLNALAKVLESKRFSRNLEPLVLSPPKARRAMMISPHPDDDVFSSGGTILRLIRDGCRVKVIYLTSGKKETYKDAEEGVLADSAARLEEESRKASERLGTDIEFWRYSAGGIEIDSGSIGKVRKVYAALRPEIVFLPFIADDHDDHRMSVKLFYEAFKDFEKLDFEVWAYQVYSTVIPNVAVDITGEIDEKLRLINLWETRMKDRDWAHYIRGLNAFNSRFLKTNQARYAELFFVVPAEEYINLCRIYFEGM